MKEIHIPTSSNGDEVQKGASAVPSCSGKNRRVYRWVVPGLAVLALLLWACIALAVKNRQYEDSLAFVDEVLEMADRHPSPLTRAETIRMNRLRLAFLQQHYADELNDTVPDRRDLAYARCLYNLSQAVEAHRAFLPADSACRQDLYVHICMQGGFVDDARQQLQRFVRQNHYIDRPEGEMTRLMWAAVILGLPDEAEALHAAVEAHDDAWRLVPDHYVKYGHVLLLQGKVDHAIDFYEAAVEKADETNPHARHRWLERQIRQTLTADLDVMRWFGVGDEAAMQQVARHMRLTLTSFATAPSDSSFSDSFRRRIAGTWRQKTKTAVRVMQVYGETPVVRCSTFDVRGRQVDCTLYQCRFSSRGGAASMDLLDLQTGQLAGFAVRLSGPDRITVSPAPGGSQGQRDGMRVYRKAKN